MFFIGIMGTGNKEKIITEIPNIKCKACGRLGQYTVLQRYDYVHVFFIPLWKWNKQYFVKERTCQTLFKLDSEIGTLIEKGDSHEIVARDLQELCPVRRCEGCGEILEEKFVYCPYCSREQNR